MKKVPLTYPLPAVQWLRSNNGWWYSVEWTKDAKEIAIMDHFKYVSSEVSV
jgi:hypothetical protein